MDGCAVKIANFYNLNSYCVGSLQKLATYSVDVIADHSKYPFLFMSLSTLMAFPWKDSVLSQN